MQAKPTIPASEKIPATSRKSLWPLVLVVFACAAPMIFSYLAYYVIKPQGRTNYGTLLDPRSYPIPKLDLVSLDDKPALLNNFKGKWMLVQVDASDCNKACVDKLYYMRLTQGKEMDRVERVWLVTDSSPIQAELLKKYEGTIVLRANLKQISAWLPTEQGSSVTDHFYMIDPLGNLMMRFPKDPDANKIKKDMIKLLKASRIG